MYANQHLENLSEIRNLMNRSVKFLSLSGLSGVFAGVYAIIAAFVVFSYLDYSLYINSYAIRDIQFLVLVALVTLLLTITTAYFLTKNKAKKNQVKLWDKTSKKAFYQMATPLFCGGVICLILIVTNKFGLVSPFTLIFYGLSLVSVSEYTFKTIKFLGFFEILLGAINLVLIGYGIVFWVIGFGLLHIIYGSFMYYKYDRK